MVKKPVKQKQCTEMSKLKPISGKKCCPTYSAKRSLCILEKHDMYYGVVRDLVVELHMSRPVTDSDCL